MEGMCSLADITNDELKQMKDEVRKFVTVDWENVWKNMIDLLYIDFFETLLDIFRKHSSKMKEILSQAKNS